MKKIIIFLFSLISTGIGVVNAAWITNYDVNQTFKTAPNAYITKESSCKNDLESLGIAPTNNIYNNKVFYSTELIDSDGTVDLIMYIQINSSDSISSISISFNNKAAVFRRTFVNYQGYSGYCIEKSNYMNVYKLAIYDISNVNTISRNYVLNSVTTSYYDDEECTDYYENIYFNQKL